MEELQAPPPRERRGSLFEVKSSKPKICGSSVMTMAIQPESSYEDVSFRRPPMKVEYENTYKMAPDVRFQVGKVKTIIDESLATLEKEQYEVYHCRELAKHLSQDIKDKVKEIGMPRHKIISWVTIGQRCDQSMRIGSRCLWDDGNDNFAWGEFKNPSLHATAIVYGIYQD
ncbi:PREDICTED: tctex1 domain-containing protein 1-like [Branchiostoma belcheri]|uniref:Tctex1 domain-containing protein 1-like n=1 Tax=Branchiostoma belcheri TaxID=7741 RepID=A0A6P4YVQ6_BRABE|nr:PREDICTED: tctex1 domain-containing protein 1-like [Branchiostoma belcheri]